MKSINTLIGMFSAAPAAMVIDEYNISNGTTVSGEGVAFRGNDLVAIAVGLGVVPG